MARLEKSGRKSLTTSSLTTLSMSLLVLLVVSLLFLAYLSGQGYLIIFAAASALAAYLKWRRLG